MRMKKLFLSMFGVLVFSFGSLGLVNAAGFFDADQTDIGGINT
jgi:hypothetical protein